MEMIDDYRIKFNDKIVAFEIKIGIIIEFDTLVIVMIRETKEVPNNIIAFNSSGEIEWYVNDIVQAKIPRGFDGIEKRSDNVLRAYCELGIVYDIDIINKKIINQTYIR